ncbi:hypothetical protein MBLNU459_g5244t1 [Dothideomycetes sp. NU459]
MIYFQLLAEKEATESWTKQIQLSGGPTPFPPEKLDEVKRLLIKLEIYYEKAQRKYVRIDPSPRGSNRASSLRAKTAFVLLNFEDLRELVATIHAMNTALRAIAPPLPPYTTPRYSEGMAPELVSVLTRAYPTAPQRNPFPPEHVNDSPESSGSESSVSLVEKQPKGTSLETIYKLSLRGLRQLAKLRKINLIDNAAARLQLWGIGLFSEAFSLDMIFDVHGDSENPLREGLLEAFATILVFQQRDLFLLAEASTESERAPQSIICMEISAILGTDDLSNTALKQMTTYLESRRTDPNEAEDEQTEVDLKAAPRIWAGLDDASRTANSISRAVECLFILLPAIRAEIDLYCHAVKLAENEMPATAADNSTAHNIEHRLDRVEQLLREKAKSAEAQGRRVGFVEPFVKQKLRMEELYRGALVNPENEAALRKRSKQDELAKILDDFINKANSNQNVKTPPSVTPLPVLEYGESRWIPEKSPTKAEKNSNNNTDPLVEGLLSSLRNIDFDV